MSEAEATTKPVEAGQPEVVEEKPVEETSVEKTEDKTEEKAEEKSEEKTEANQESTDKDGKILKTKAKIDYDNPRNNRKFDPSVRGVTDDPLAIRKQVIIPHTSSHLDRANS